MFAWTGRRFVLLVEHLASPMVIEPVGSETAKVAGGARSLSSKSVDYERLVNRE